METLGLMNRDDALYRAEKAPFLKNQLQQYGLYQFDCFAGVPTFQRLAVITNAQGVDSENNGALVGEGALVSLNIVRDTQEQPWLICSADPVNFMVHPGHGAAVSVNDRKAPPPLGSYDWADRGKAVQAFLNMLALHASPALSAALQRPQSLTQNAATTPPGP